MRGIAAALIAGASLAVVPMGAAAAAVDESRFRYTRSLSTPAGGPVLVTPDRPLFAHSADGFADLRVLAADGTQVPWRALPETSAGAARPVRVLNRGRRGREVVVLLDLGPRRRIVERIELGIPQRSFVGRVEVRGADERRGPFTRLSTTVVYDLAGARRARSTALRVPPTDFRFLLLRASGVRTIRSASVAADPPRARLEPRRGAARVRTAGRRTVVTIDLGFRMVPVDVVRAETATPRFDRPVVVHGSNDGRVFVGLAAGRIFRFDGPSQTAVPVAAAHRFLRVTIANGDDPPLQRLRVALLARPRTLLVAGGYAKPYRLLYGNRRVPPPAYDFAELPAASLGLEGARRGRLGPERANPAFGLRPEESFFERHDWLVEAALALVALVLGTVSLLAFRRRSGEPVTR